MKWRQFLHRPMIIHFRYKVTIISEYLLGNKYKHFHVVGGGAKPTYKIIFNEQSNSELKIRLCVYIYIVSNKLLLKYLSAIITFYYDKLSVICGETSQLFWKQTRPSRIALLHAMKLYYECTFHTVLITVVQLTILVVAKPATVSVHTERQKHLQRIEGFKQKILDGLRYENVPRVTAFNETIAEKRTLIQMYRNYMRKKDGNYHQDSEPIPGTTAMYSYSLTTGKVSSRVLLYHESSDINRTLADI